MDWHLSEESKYFLNTSLIHTQRLQHYATTRSSSILDKAKPSLWLADVLLCLLSCSHCESACLLICSPLISELPVKYCPAGQSQISDISLPSFPIVALQLSSALTCYQPVLFTFTLFPHFSLLFVTCGYRACSQGEVWTCWLKQTSRLLQWKLCNRQAHITSTVLTFTHFYFVQQNISVWKYII